MDNNDWIKQAAAQYKKNGVFDEDDGLMSDDEATEWASSELENDPSLIDKDPTEYAKKADVTNWFKE